MTRRTLLLAGVSALAGRGRIASRLGIQAGVVRTALTRDFDCTLKRLANIGQQAPSREQLTPQALATYQGDEIAKWWPVIKAAEIRGE